MIGIVFSTEAQRGMEFSFLLVFFFQLLPRGHGLTNHSNDNGRINLYDRLANLIRGHEII